MKKTVIVVGAGVVGATTAYFLARHGYDVTIIDRESGPALQCSKANGGQISVCNAETWNTWKNVWKGIKWMAQKDAPLLIRPSPSLPKLKWLAGFLAETVRGSYTQNTIDTIKMGKRSSYLYDTIQAHEGINFDQAQCGMMHVYTTANAGSFQEAEKVGQMFESHGVEWTPMTRESIVKLDPNMASFNDLLGGFHTPSDWVGDAHIYANEILRVCQEKYGVRTVWSTEVVDVTAYGVWCRTEVEGFDQLRVADAIVISNGYEIAKTAAELGDNLNVYPVKGYSITIENAVGAPSLSLLDDDRKIVSSTLGTRLRVAGTAELADDNLDVRPDRIEPLVKWVQRNFPSIDTTNRTDWACLRPMNANMMPIVRASSRHSNVFYHGGHGHLGWTLSAATSEHLTKLVSDALQID